MAQFLNFKDDYFGLTDKEIEQNLNLYGYNVYSDSDTPPQSFSTIKVFLKPTFLLMVVAAALYMLLGEYITGVVIVLFAALFTCFEIYKGTRLDDNLSEIQRSTYMKYRVIRNGKLELILKEYIVPDDIMIIQAGENVPADAFILDSQELMADEYALTGDNTPVTKYVGAQSEGKYKKTFIYSGTKITAGNAVVKVVATGVDTNIYRKNGEPEEVEEYYTKLECTVKRIIPICNIIACAMMLLTIILAVVSDKDWLNSAISGITVAMCFIPTEIASIIRCYYIYGAQKLIKKQAIVKKLGVIEDLNSLSVLCVDKTGTITKNQMEVHDVYSANEELLFNIVTLACEKNSSDPLEQAIVMRYTFGGSDIGSLYENTLLQSYPFSRKTSIAGNLWEVNGAKLMCIKGAPEAIFPLCDIKGERLFEAQKKHSEYCREGYQVLAVGCAEVTDEKYPSSTKDCRYRLIGLIAFATQTRESIPFAVRSCQKAGIQVVMMTGDSPETARAIALKIGIKSEKVVTGKMLRQANADMEQLDLRDVNIFARITPEQKLEIVRQLQQSGEIVAITGTSISDSDVLKHADVGITLSQHTTGSCYEAADLIMNNDDFSSIVDTIRETRQLHKNIKRGISAVISASVSFIIISALNLLFSQQLMLNPALLALMSVVILPLFGFAYILNTADIKGNLSTSGFISRGTINVRFFVRIFIQAAAIAIVSFGSYAIMYLDTNIGYARSFALLTLITGLVFMCYVNMFSNESVLNVLNGKNRIVFLGGLGIILLTLLVIFIPYVNTLFGLTSLNVLTALIAIAAGCLSSIWWEIIKYNQRNKT